MTKIRSEFIIERLNQRRLSRYADRSYIQDLLYIEKTALHGILNWGGAMLLGRVKTSHPKEYIVIMKELAPEKYQRQLESDRRFEEECEARARWIAGYERKERLKLEKLWIAYSRTI